MFLKERPKGINPIQPEWKEYVVTNNLKYGYGEKPGIKKAGAVVKLPDDAAEKLLALKAISVKVIEEIPEVKVIASTKKLEDKEPETKDKKPEIETKDKEIEEGKDKKNKTDKKTEEKK